MSADRYTEILAKQLLMNRQTWATLQAHGVTEQSQLRLEFAYNAPRREVADALSSLIREQTNYEVRVEGNGNFLRRKWRVTGATQSTVISPDILDQWVTWMVSAGKEQGCDFDGWGTSL